MFRVIVFDITVLLEQIERTLNYVAEIPLAFAISIEIESYPQWKLFVLRQLDEFVLVRSVHLCHSLFISPNSFG